MVFLDVFQHLGHRHLPIALELDAVHQPVRAVLFVTPELGNVLFKGAPIVRKLANVRHLRQKLLDNQVSALSQHHSADGAFSQLYPAGATEAMAPLALVHRPFPRHLEADGALHGLFQFVCHYAGLGLLGRL